MPKRLVLGILATGLCVVTAGAARGVSPQQVSPAGLVELRCPTFSWSAVSGAAGYELLVYEVLPAGDVGEEPLLSVRLPGGAGSWTPPGASCLAAGGRYAWTLRGLGTDAEGGWAESVLFEVAAAPSLGEVEAALATLRRYLGAEQGGRSPAAGAVEGETSRPGAAVAERMREAAASRTGGEGPRSVTAAAVPSLGTPSLTVDSSIALGEASNLFKAGSVFLWDDTDGNTALGRLALASATGTTNNTAFGREALHDTMSVVPFSGHGSSNTAVGDQALRANTTGYQNTANGDRALYSNTTGHHNTASGYFALFSNITGYGNTAIGHRALRTNNSGTYNTAIGHRALYGSSGSRNTAVGRRAGYNATTGSDNIFLGSGALSVAEESNTIRIGGSTGSGEGEQNRTFIAGIWGTVVVTGVPVLVDASGQLGVSGEPPEVSVSSARFKEEIEDLAEVGERLAALRPVTFRYRPELVPGGGGLEVGLIAEEVAELFPELATRDPEGRPHGVRYDLLSVLLLREMTVLREQVEALEAGGLPAPGRRPWWRRGGGEVSP